MTTTDVMLSTGADPAAPLAFDPLAPEFTRSPDALYRRLLELDPVHWYAPMRAWIVSRYEDVRALLLAEAKVTSDPSFWEAHVPPPEGRPLSRSEWLRSSPGYSFGGEEGWYRIRRAAMSAFTPRAMVRMEVEVRRIVAEHIDAMASRLDAGEEIDLVEAYASRVPGRAIGRVLGVTPDAERDRWFADHAAVVIRVGNPLIGPEDIAAIDVAAPPFLAFLEEAIDARKARRTDDFLGDLVHAEGEEFPRDMIVVLLVALLIAGIETTGSAISMALRLLAAHPDQRRLLLEGKVTDAMAFEETLRVDHPGKFLVRFARADFDLHERAIRRGQLILLPLGASNRDPRVFSDPDRFDVAREDARAISFGAGPHFCLGAALARLEGRIAVGDFVRRFPDYEVREDGVTWNQELVLRTPRTMPVRRRKG